MRPLCIILFTSALSGVAGARLWKLRVERTANSGASRWLSKWKPVRALQRRLCRRLGTQTKQQQSTNNALLRSRVNDTLIGDIIDFDYWCWLVFIGCIRLSFLFRTFWIFVEEPGPQAEPYPYATSENPRGTFPERTPTRTTRSRVAPKPCLTRLKQGSNTLQPPTTTLSGPNQEVKVMVFDAIQKESRNPNQLLQWNLRRLQTQSKVS